MLPRVISVRHTEVAVVSLGIVSTFPSAVTRSNQFRKKSHCAGGDCVYLALAVTRKRRLQHHTVLVGIVSTLHSLSLGRGDCNIVCCGAGSVGRGGCLLSWLMLSTLDGSVESDGLDALGVALGVLLQPLVVHPVRLPLLRSLSLRSCQHQQPVCKKTGDRVRCTACRVGKVTTASIASI